MIMHDYAFALLDAQKYKTIMYRYLSKARKNRARSDYAYKNTAGKYIKYINDIKNILMIYRFLTFMCWSVVVIL